MVHAYRLVFPPDPSAPDPLWEWQPPFMHCLQWQARTFGHRVEERSFITWEALDRGTLDRQEAIVRAAERTGLSVRNLTDLMQQVPPALVAIPGTVELLYRLKAQGHKLYCLSNMHSASIEHLEHTYAFWDVFERAVISCRLHVIKPEPAIYAYLLETYGLDRADTVFIDDTEINLEAAAQVGIQTIKFESPTQCEGRLKALGCI